MLIGKDWKIESDSLNITISHRRKAKKTGKESWVVKGYYSTLSNALKGLADFEIKGTGLKDFKEVVKKQEEIYALIHTTASTIVKEAPIS